MKKIFILALILLLPLIAPSDKALAKPPTATIAEFAQLITWLEEPGGLYEWLAQNPGNDSDPTWYQAKGEQELYNWIIDGKLGILTKRMLDAAAWVSNSYATAKSYTYDVGSFTLSRTQLNDLFDVVLIEGNREIPTRISSSLTTVRLGPFIQNSTQYILPTTGGFPYLWEEGAGDGDIINYDEMDEGFGAGRGSGSGPDDDTTYWKTESNASGAILSAGGYNSGTDPGTGTGIKYRTREKKLSGAKQVDLEVRFLNPTTVQVDTYIDIGSSYVTREITLSTAQGDALDWNTTMRIELYVTLSGGGSPTRAATTAHEFETPDPPPETTFDYGAIF